jgi:hypothetical protein
MKHVQWLLVSPAPADLAAATVAVVVDSAADAAVSKIFKSFFEMK